MIKKTFLNKDHIKLGAKMVEFAGWEMPVSYKGILEEHKNVRNNVGIFDVSHMGEFFITGKDVLKFLQKIVPQDISKLSLGHALYCQLTNENGGIVDDLIIYKLEEAKYMLIVNASRIDEDLNHITLNSEGFEVDIDNQSHNYSMIALQGPLSSSLIEKMGIGKNRQPKYFAIQKEVLKGIDVLLSRTGYTGEDGFEILMKNKYASILWNKILEEGKEFNIEPIGLGARDTLRLEAGLHLFGNDLDENTTPVEAGLSWSIPKDKKEDFNGREVIYSQMGLIEGGQFQKTKKMIAFEMTQNAIARHGYEIYFEGCKAGIVTSGAPSPTLGKGIGLGYIYFQKNSEIFLNKTSFSIGTDIQIMVRNRLYNAKVVKRPFVIKHVLTH